MLWKSGYLAAKSTLALTLALTLATNTRTSILNLTPILRFGFGDCTRLSTTTLTELTEGRLAEARARPREEVRWARLQTQDWTI